MDEKQHREMSEFRHKLPLEVNERFLKQGRQKIGTDTAVLPEFDLDLYKFIKNRIEKEKIDYVLYGHIGDSHLHANMFPVNETQRKTALSYIQK